MKTFIIFLLIGIFLLVDSSFVYSQNQTDVTKIIPGKKYKIVLFDDSEIIGKVISIDSINVSIRTDAKIMMIIPKSNILYYSSSMTPGKYNCSLALLGGISVFSGNNSYYYSSYYSSAKSGPSVDLSFYYYMSDSKAIRIDAGYNYLNPNYTSPYYYSGSNGYSTFQGGQISMFYFKGNILVGTFVPEERILASVSLGFGIHYAKVKEFTEKDKGYDSTVYTQTYPARSEVHALITLGASLGYRFSKHIGVQAEIEYHLVTGQGFLMFGGNNYFPMRAGIFYMF